MKQLRTSLNIKRIVFTLILICLSANIISAQTTAKNHLSIPERLKPLLTKRVEQFVEVQRQEKWESLFDFFSQAQGDQSMRRFSNERKRCVMELFRANPILDFKNPKTTTSTANWDKTLNNKVWTITGDGEIKIASGNKRQSISMSIRYFNHNWFFSVPDFYYNKWKEKKFALANLSAEKKDLLQVVVQPGSPVEIYDVSVKIKPESYSLRDYKFKVRNKTKKKITSYGYRFIEASQTVYSSDEVKPKEFVSSSGSYGANHLFCEDKERSMRVFITEARFSDGTKWKGKL